MQKVSLTSNEFLSIYTGVLLGENFSVILKGLSKYFGYPVTTIDSPECLKIFRHHINNTRPDLVNVINKLGRFIRDRRFDIDTQINEYVGKFELLYGKDVEIDQFSNEEFYKMFPDFRFSNNRYFDKTSYIQHSEKEFYK